MARLIDPPPELDFDEAIEFLMDQVLDLKGRVLTIDADLIDTAEATYSLTFVARLLYEITDDLVDDLDRGERRRELAGEITSLLVKRPKVRLRLLEQATATNLRQWRLTQALGSLESGDDPGKATDSIVHALMELSERELYEFDREVDWHAGTAEL